MQVNTCVDGVKRFTGLGVNGYSVLDTVLPLFSVHRYSPTVLRQLRFSLVNWKSLLGITLTAAAWILKVRGQ